MFISYVFQCFHFINQDFIFTEKYPEIKELFGVDPLFKWKVIALTLIQFVMLFVVQNQSWFVTLFLAYCFGGVINHALMLGKENFLHANEKINKVSVTFFRP